MDGKAWGYDYTLALRLFKSESERRTLTLARQGKMCQNFDSCKVRMSSARYRRSKDLRGRNADETVRNTLSG